MQSLDDLKKELTEWIDGRIDEAIDRGNADLLKDLDSRFKGLEDGLNGVGETVDGVSKDVGGIADSVTKLIQTVIAIPQGIVGDITEALNRMNPFHLP